MSMIKIASSDDWSCLSDRPAVEIKISSRGLVRSDAVKIAAEVGDRFIAEVRKIEDDLDLKNHKYAHNISCGATEVTGANRNGDGWDKAALLSDMWTYLKHAKCYRDHRNKKDDHYYGKPKVAFYDEDRGYGRLLCEYHANEDACRDKLAKVADLEIEQLDKGECFRTSHGSRIQFDTCSTCGNQATKRSEYCDEKGNGGDCNLFGCKHGLSKIADDGRVQFVHNPNNVFYDCSSIGLSKHSARQADRVAYASPYTELMEKVASESHVRGSAWLAEQLGLADRPDLISVKGLSPWQEKMARIAVELSESSYDLGGLYDDYDAEIPESLQGFYSKPDSVKQAMVVDLRRRGQMFGPRILAKLAGADLPTANLAAVFSEGLISRVCTDDTVGTLVKTSAFTRSPVSATTLLSGDCDFKQASIAPNVVSARKKLANFSADRRETKNADSELAAKIAMDFAAIQIVCNSQIFC